MADKISGKIQYLNERDTKVGKMYSIKVDGTNYGVGKYPPRGVGQGDVVEFEVEYNGNYPNVARGTLRKVEGASAPPAAAPATKAAYKAANSYDDRQDVISKQAALNTALAFLEFAKANDKLPVPAAKGAGYGYLKTVWLQEAAALYELNTGKVWDMPESDVEEAPPKPAKKVAKKAPPVEETEEEGFDDTVDDVW